eukprot:TRINITY_DN4647_c0_g1_i1.p1 TRINITY_DN4647_c0_g1~~TRINITY_DN4647_c0_g1_i1.p1  ORF type:complete len:777 (-),score=163.18 TRINITY_DN4647_c0_g1_i1:1697-4027(-)
MADGQRPRRARALLKNYYGVGENEDDGGSKDPLDSSNFQPDKYVEQIMRGASLQDLIQKDQAMSTEIKSLDSEMQMLVYENYNKFISATDTIRKMKGNVQSMEQQMTTLSSSMDKITETNDAINSNLSDRRGKLEKLSRIRRLLKKLQFLFDLPGKLQICLTAKEYEEAVKYYLQAKEVLVKHTHISSLKAISEECTTIMGNVRDKLRASIDDEDSAVACENIMLLVQLQEPLTSLRHRFISSRGHVLHARLEHFQGGSVYNTFEELVEALQEQVLSDFVGIVRAFKQMFLETGAPDIPKANDELREFVKDIMSKYFFYIRERVAKHVVASDQLVEGLQRVWRDVSQLHAVMPEARTLESAGEVVVEGFRAKLDASLTECSSTIDAQLKLLATNAKTAASSLESSAHDALPAHADIESLVDLSGRLYRAVNASLERVIQSVRPMLASNESYLARRRTTFLDTLQVHMQKTCLLLDDSIMRAAYQITTFTKPRDSAYILVLAKFCRTFEQMGVSSVQSMVGGVAPGVELILLGAQDLLDRFRATAKNLLVRYVDLQGARLSKLVRKSIETPNWLEAKEPRQVRLSMELVVTELVCVHLDARQLFPDDHHSSHSSTTGSDMARSAPGLPQRGHVRQASATSGPTRPAQGAGRARAKHVFTKRAEMFAPVDFNRNSIVSSIAKIVCKSFFECVRLQTFNQHGMQQIQVDAAFLRDPFCKLIEDESVVDGLLTEVSTSASDRAIVDTPLDKSVVDALCAKKRESMKEVFHAIDRDVSAKE